MAKKLEAELPDDLLNCRPTWPAEDTLSVTAGEDMLADLCRDEEMTEMREAPVSVSDGISLPTVERQTVGGTGDLAPVAGPALPEFERFLEFIIRIDLKKGGCYSKYQKMFTVCLYQCDFFDHHLLFT